jgi:hypothetical protein
MDSVARIKRQRPWLLMGSTVAIALGLAGLRLMGLGVPQTVGLYVIYWMAGTLLVSLIILVGHNQAIAFASRMQVSANGQIVGVWRFPPGRYFFGEDQFIIPGRFIGEETAVLRFENMPDRGVSKMASYYYWVFVSDAE